MPATNDGGRRRRNGCPSIGKPPAQPEPQHLGIVHKDRGVMPIRSTYANRMQNTQLLRQKR